MNGASGRHTLPVGVFPGPWLVLVLFHWITQPGLRPQKVVTHVTHQDVWQLRNLGTFPETGGGFQVEEMKIRKAQTSKHKTMVGLAMPELYDVYK